MRTTLCSIVFVASLVLQSTSALSGPDDPAKTPPPKPILVLVEANPWLMVRGTDSPTFALYDDRRIVLCSHYAPHTVGTAWADVSRYSTVVLDESARKKFIASALGDEPKRFAALNASYTLSEATDQPTSTIHVWLDGERHSVSVYGNIRDTASQDRTKAPKEFLRAFDAVVGYTNASATAWSPEKVEVMLWDFSDAKEASVQWPTDWPGLDSPAARKFREDYYWIALDVRNLDRLLALLRGLKQRFGEPCQAVEVGKRKWAADFRIPFPAEEQWLKQ